MRKMAGDEQCCMNAAFATELAKIQGMAGDAMPNQGQADVAQRRAVLNGQHGVLGSAGISRSTAKSVAVNQGPVTEQPKV